jgi:hypothetical protein
VIAPLIRGTEMTGVLVLLKGKMNDGSVKERLRKESVWMARVTESGDAVNRWFSGRKRDRRDIVHLAVRRKKHAFYSILSGGWR